jgi:hypothetical protein
MEVALRLTREYVEINVSRLRAAPDQIRQEIERTSFDGFDVVIERVDYTGMWRQLLTIATMTTVEQGRPLAALQQLATIVGDAFDRAGIEFEFEGAQVRRLA